MSKDSIAVINGHEYKYRYNPETKLMDYLGPVGEDAPPLSEAKFRELFKHEGVIPFEQFNSALETEKKMLEGLNMDEVRKLMAGIEKDFIRRHPRFGDKDIWTFGSAKDLLDDQIPTGVSPWVNFDKMTYDIFVSEDSPLLSRDEIEIVMEPTGIGILILDDSGQVQEELEENLGQ
jgi:hypothetical protein